MSNANSSLKKNMGFLLIAILSIALIVELSQFTPVNALKNYFNCTTKKVNNEVKFGIQDAFKCYDGVFKGAQKYVNETYQNPDMNNLTTIKEVVYANTNTSVDTPTTTTTNNNVTTSKAKTTIDGDKLIKPIKLNDDLKTVHVSKTVPNEKQSVTHNTNMYSKGSPKPTPSFNLNSDLPPNPESYDLPFSAVIPK